MDEQVTESPEKRLVSVMWLAELCLAVNKAAGEVDDACGPLCPGLLT